MKDERLIDLVQRSLDGATSESEQMELSQRMAEDPAARSYFEEMEAVAEMLGSASTAATPVDFTASVMREVRSHASTAAAATGNVRPFVKRRRNALRLGLGIAAAAAIAFFLAPSAFVAPDPATLRGTMVAPVSAQRSTISAGPHTTIEVIESREEVELRFNTVPGARGEAHVTFDGRLLRNEAGSPGAVLPGKLQVDLDSATIVRLRRLTAEAVALSVETRFPEQPPFRTTIKISSTGDKSSDSTNFQR